MPNGTERIDDLIHCMHFLRRLPPHAEEDERHHQEEHGEKDHRARRKLGDAAADGQSGIDRKTPVEHLLLCHVELLSPHLTEPVCVCKFGGDFVKNRIAEDGHRGKGCAPLAIDNDKVHLFARLQPLLEFAHGYDKDSIPLHSLHIRRRLCRDGTDRLTDNIIPFAITVRDEFLHAVRLSVHTREHAPILCRRCKIGRKVTPRLEKDSPVCI